MALAISNRYAKALVDIVMDPKSGLSPQDALQQLSAFSGLMLSSPALRGALISPAVPNRDKRTVVDKLAGRLGAHRLVRSFLFVLIDHRRTPLLDEIREAFQAQLDEKLGVVRPKVTSARELAPEQRAQLEAQLRQMTGQEVRCGYTTDPSLLGGVAVRIGSTYYDGSARGQLQSLRRKLASEA